MSLSRSPSPRPGGGWASPGLSSQFSGVNGRGGSPHKGYGGLNGEPGAVTWESARAKTQGVHGGHPAYSSSNVGFFNRHMRSISNSLPSFNIGGDRSYAEKEKLGRGRWAEGGAGNGRIRPLVNKIARKLRLRGIIALAIVLAITLFYTTRESALLARRPSWNFC